MRGPTAAPVCLSARLRGVLECLSRRQTLPQRLVRRLRIVLAAADGQANDQIARQLGLGRLSVRRWRGRWLIAAPRLEAAVAAGDEERLLAQLVADALDDAPRSGAPDTFSAEQIVQIIAIACEPPADSGRPISHWTPDEIADEAVKRGIVAAISPRSVGRFLGSGGSQAAPEPVLAHAQTGRPGRLRRAGGHGV